MIPFHRIYSWLFKSFAIGQENKIIEQFIEQWYQKIMIIKRSWFFVLWIFITRGILIFSLSLVSTWIAWNNIEIKEFQYVITFSNIIMAVIMFLSSFIYLRHFRRVHSNTDKIITDLDKLKNDLKSWDEYFIRFFNWSLTNQVLLVFLVIVEISFIFLHSNKIFTNNHIWFLILDFVIIISQFTFLEQYRKKMIDAEMDFNIIVHGKIFLINQSWVLSNTQTIESDKIKTIRSSFPDKISSIFNYWNIEILTEWDTAMMWALTMNHVMNPSQVVSSMQLLLWESRSLPPILQKNKKKIPEQQINETIIINNNWENNHHKWELTTLHTIDTRWKIRDILR